MLTINTPVSKYYLFHRCAILLCLASVFAYQSAVAEERSVLEDARLYVTSPLRWDQKDWLYFGGTMAVIAGSHHYDSTVREHFMNRYPPDLQDSHSKQDALPTVAVIAGTFVASWLWDDTKGYRETSNMIEAGIFSGASALLTKQLISRSRPNVTSNTNSWNNGASFPSTHVSVTAAVGTILAESGNDDMRWVRRVLGYGLIAGTSYTRLKHNQHWLSDTVAGAALGVSTARFMLNRDHSHNEQSLLMLTPSDQGVTLSYIASFR
jgi:hypothetical protein